MSRMHHGRAFVLAVGLGFLAPLLVAAEEPDSRPRFLYGGEVALSYAPEDPGYFNYTEYRRDSLRIFRVNFAFEFRAAESVAVLAEIRSDNLDAPRPYALYLRFHPFPERAFDLQVGRIPPVFGAFSRRRYEYDNPLIGYPLPYQYPTLVRADSAPDSLETLLHYRGYGARVRYPIGDTSVGAGLPQLNPLKWDTGVQVRLGHERMEVAAALTQGTVSNPRVRDDNEGKQIATRLALKPTFGSEVGASAAWGEYVSDTVTSELPDDEHRTKLTALGADAELARGAWLISAEAIWSRWNVPTLPMSSLSAWGWMAEGRYKIHAGLYLAARISGARFESVEAPDGPVSWDAPVTRVEAGGGYFFNRHLLAKLSLQYNTRDGGPVHTRWIPAVQLLFWF